jgi:Flp pilus assembly pilin Flp
MKNRGFPHRRSAPPALLVYIAALVREYGLKGMDRSMNKTIQKLYHALRSRKGQSLVEYSLILALIAIVAITVLRGLGKHINNTLSSVNANLP